MTNKPSQLPSWKRARWQSLLLRPAAGSVTLGLVVAASLIGAEALLLYLLERLAPADVYGLVFLLGVLVVSTWWGVGLAATMSVASAIAFNYFRTRPGGSILPTDAHDAVAIAIFLAVALLANTLAGLARSRSAEADQRSRDADLAAELARLMLRVGDLRPALDRAAQRFAQVLALPFAAIELEAVPTDEHRSAIPLRDGARSIGTVVVPAGLPRPMQQRIRELVPSVEALVAAARQREAIADALEASREEMQRFFDLSSDLLCISDQVSFKRVNPAFEQVLGYSSEELLSRPSVDFIHPADRGPARAALEELLSGHGPIQFENRCIRSDGSEVWLEWNIAADKGLQYGAARDVTERRREQDRLRETQQMVETSRDEVSMLAEQQAALRRVATLVARGVTPPEVFSAVVEELSQSQGVNGAALFRGQPDGEPLVVAVCDESGLTKMPVGERISSQYENVADMVIRTGHAARMDSHEKASASAAPHIGAGGLRSVVGAPILLHNRVWGAAIVGSSRPEPQPPDTEARIGDFADLVATAIANAATRAELTRSRARIVAAADEARRRFERDLHDGAQQRLVSVGLELRTAEASVPAELPTLKQQISDIVTGLAGVSEDLQDFSRGIHPAILSHGGLGPALKTLARRSAIPIELDLSIGRRLSESVEVAAYYVVAEALTNAAKHAQASAITVTAEADGVNLLLSIRDNGIGGADSTKGSGLIGLVDRVETIGGQMEILSHAGSGTSLRVNIPCEVEIGASGS